MLTEIVPGQLLAASPMNRCAHVDLIAMLQDWCEAHAPNRSWFVFSVYVLLSHVGEVDAVLAGLQVPKLIGIVAEDPSSCIFE